MLPDLALINPQWLELPLSRANFHSPKGARAIEVRLYRSSRHGSPSGKMSKQIIMKSAANHVLMINVVQCVLSYI